MDNFEAACRLKLRFETSQGQLSVEELFDLSLQSLDTIAKKVNKQLRDEGEESFIPVKNTSKKATHNNLRLEILQYIINSKVQEQEERKSRTERLATISRLRELAERKADEQLASKSLEEIQKEIAELEASTV
jgi:hypothetical protein